jgi:hypothetical protein
MVGTTEEEEKGLYLRRYGVPDEGIALPIDPKPKMLWLGGQGVFTTGVGLIAVSNSFYLILMANVSTPNFSQEDEEEDTKYVKIVL